jgi:formylglycine-generating enzyme required for sulfatase activity
VSIAIALIARCGSITDPEHASGDSALTISFAAAQIQSADSIRLSVLDSAGAVLARTSVAYAQRRATLAAIPCDQSATLFIEGLAARGYSLFHGTIELGSLFCDSPRVRIDTDDITPPAPRDVLGAVQPAAIALSWISEADSFAIERAHGRDGAFKPLSVVSEAAYLDVDVEIAAGYLYRVVALNPAGASPAAYSPLFTLPGKDLRGPDVSLLSHASRDTIGDTAVMLFGSVRDSSGVAAVTVNDSPATIRDGLWQRRVVIAADSLDIELRAFDSSSSANQSSLHATLFRDPALIDTAAPVITVLSHADSATVTQRQITLSGVITDKSGIDSFVLEDRAILLDDYRWRIDSVMLEPGLNELILRAADASPGRNAASARIRLIYHDPCADPTPPALRLLSHDLRDTVGSRIVTLYGSVAGAASLASLRADSIELTAAHGVWELPGRLLTNGRNDIRIIAADGCDTPTSDTLSISIWYIPSYIETANHAPFFLSSPADLQATIKAGDTLTQSLAAGDTDPYDRLRFTADSPLAIRDSAIVWWATAIADTGVRRLSARVFDQDSASDSIIWTVTVADPGSNTPPTFTTRRADLLDSIMVGLLYRDTLHATDLEQTNGLVFSLVDKPDDAYIAPETGVMSWRPGAERLGLHVLTAEVTDDSGATDRLIWAIRVFDPSLPVVNAGADTAVSIRDTIRLHGAATSASGEIAAYEWDIGATGHFNRAGADTTCIAPDTANPRFACVLRAWDSFDRISTDTAWVTVLRDKPIVDAGGDQVVWTGASFTLDPVATDSFGTIGKWEWDIGATGTFIDAPDSGRYDGTAPREAGGLHCALRVTDDDGNQALDTLTIHVVGGAMRLVEIGGGQAMWIGGNRGEADERPAHLVTVHSFMIDTTEVTQAEYEAVMMVNPSTFVDPDAPVEGVTWYDAALFCNARGIRDGYDTVYTYSGLSGAPGDGSIMANPVIHYDRIGYRLPTEAEWEIACARPVLHDSLWYWGDDRRQTRFHAWYDSNAGSRTRAVAQKAPNSRSLYDMAGNVWEWCNDWYDAEYYTLCARRDTTQNPVGPSGGTARIIRGGSWQDPPDDLRTTRRGMGLPSWSAGFVGFRCVLPTKAADIEP